MLYFAEVGESCLTTLGVLFFLREILKVAYIIIPIGLIVMLSIDLFKGIINFNDDISKLFFTMLRRVMYTMFIFLIPTTVFSIFNIIGIASKDSESCWTYADEASVEEVREIQKTRQELLEEEVEKLRDEISAKYNIVDKTKTLRRIVAKKSSSSSSSDSYGTTIGQKYKLSSGELKSLAYVAQCEQGSPEGAAAEASLMANLFELKGKKYSSIVDYVKNSGWFANSESRINNPGKVSSSILSAVKDVLVNGNRTMPVYVVEHDCWDCSSKHCANGNRGDICSITTDGKKNTSISYIKGRGNYKKDNTVIRNRMGAVYTFYSFPSKGSDPFGYTEEAKNKYDKSNK